MEHSELQLSAAWFIAHKLEKSTAYKKSGEGFNQNIITEENVNDTWHYFSRVRHYYLYLKV